MRKSTKLIVSGPAQLYDKGPRNKAQASYIETQSQAKCSVMRLDFHSSLGVVSQHLSD